MKPVPRDDNGHPLTDRGTELFTYRIAGQDTTLSTLALPTDLKEIMLHVESGTEILHVNGTVPGSTTARLTSGGHSWTIPITAASGVPLAQIAAPSGTANISVFAWR
jgi:hypothetical protein